MLSPGSPFGGVSFGFVHDMIEDEFRDELSEIRSHEETFKVAEPDIPFPTFGNAEDIFELGCEDNTLLIPQPTEPFNDTIDIPDSYAFNRSVLEFQEMISVEPPSDIPILVILNGWGSWGVPQQKNLKKKKR